MEIIDNINKRLGDDLKVEITKNSKLSIIASSFSIFAFEHLSKELKGIDELNFIFSSPTFIDDKFQKISREFYIPNIVNEKQLCGGEFELRLKNELNQKAIAKECSNWIKDKVTFKSKTNNSVPLNGVINIEKGNESISYANISGFTTSDLGTTHKQGFPTLIQKVKYPNTTAFLDWFNQIWNNKDYLKDVTNQVQEYFENAFKENSPEFIYFITLFNIFNDFLEDLNEDNIPNDNVGFKDTLIWNKLFNFQKDAVIGAINKLEKYNGCIIADSVGLGKTFTALGIIKYYEKRNKDVLVLCPKKLEANWNTYRQNDKNNLFAKDRFNYDVLFHTDLSRDKGQSNGRNLEMVNWGNYSLVVIDESHNFRNNNTVVGKENRYQKLLRKIMQEGIETKVLMLSATPVNNRFNDLKNQLALAFEGASFNIDERLNTDKSVDTIFSRAQQSFNQWSKLSNEDRTSEKLLEMLDFDFFEVLDSLTIARSRKHITKYYDTTDIGKFPKRNVPISIHSPLTDKKINFESIAERLTLLNLSVYTPINYIKLDRVDFYNEKYDKKVKSGSGTFTQRDREGSLKILMKINLLKRIESSIDSFRLTLKDVIVQIKDRINILSKETSGTISGVNWNTDDDNFDWEANWGDEENLIGKKIKVHIDDIDKTRWIEDLEDDLIHLENLYEKVVGISQNNDIKLKKLTEIIENKINNPLNNNNKKIIVFTAFADTANYLYKSLKDYILQKYGIHTALITGSKRQCTNNNIGTDLNSLLTYFSPISKNKDMLYPKLNESIDLLIATDCISEGQNLQDCDFLINYDIHWNPVRIIQRFGRIDRIGSINDNITMVNFWPDVSLDAYINLKQRVEDKMLITNVTSTGDDNILNHKEKDLEYRKIQLLKLQEEVVDLEDLREGVSITDLGLNDFRVDLTTLMKKYGKTINSPDGLYAVVRAESEEQKGVIFVLRNVNNEINIDKQNRLHPYYIMYVKNNGEIIYNHIHSKKSLDALRLYCRGFDKPILEKCKEFSEETDDFKNMSIYSQLLNKSIGSIINTESDSIVNSLFKSGGTSAISKIQKGTEDFNLISFIVVK